MYSCPFKGGEGGEKGGEKGEEADEECPELCWDGSDDSDIKENTVSFYDRLWTNTFKSLNIEPLRKRKRDYKDEAEESEDEDSEDKKENEKEEEKK